MWLRCFARPSSRVEITQLYLCLQVCGVGAGGPRDQRCVSPHPHPAGPGSYAYSDELSSSMCSLPLDVYKLFDGDRWAVECVCVRFPVGRTPFRYLCRSAIRAKCYLAPVDMTAQ